MTQFDIQYRNLVERILNDGVSDDSLEVRPVYEDGTSAYTKSIFGLEMRYDSTQPIIPTTKKLAVKTAIREMMLFWVHQSVKKEDFMKWNCHVWDEWFNQEGDLGRSYAYQFESRPKKEIVEVKPRTKTHHGHLSSIVIAKLKQPTHSHKDCGKVLSHPIYGDYQIIDVVKNDGRDYAEVQFQSTGYSYSLRLRHALNAKVRDPYVRQTSGVGCLGDPDRVKNFTEEQRKKLLRVWQNMLKRCYDPSDKDYPTYGGSGVFVDPRWHVFEYFLRDIRYVPQWFLAKDNLDLWHLDKDYYSSNCYSKETTVWLHRKENALYRKASRPIYVIDSQGNRQLYLTIKEAAVDIGFDPGDGSRVLNGKQKTVAGYSIIDADDHTYPYRYEVSRNQLVELLSNIKSNPASRRLLTSFWNYKDVNKKVLQECAFQTQWRVENGKLHLILTQRSADVGLGLSFNQFQYQMLQWMIAQVSGLEPGEFIHHIGDCHIYDRHFRPLEEQISRKPLSMPTITLNKEVEDFFDFTPEDINIKDYDPHPSIKMEVAI